MPGFVYCVSTEEKSLKTAVKVVYTETSINLIADEFSLT